MPRKLIIAVATFCACLSSSASAQSLKWDSVALATYGIAAGADLHSTHKFLSETTMWEGNPLGKPFDHHPTLLVAVSAAADAGAVTLLYRMPFFRNRPTLRRVALYGAASVARLPSCEELRPDRAVALLQDGAAVKILIPLSLFC
jgi:hypothetical protein